MSSVITEAVVTTIADLFSLGELQEKLREATMNLLENPDRIVSASTGSGASYSKSMNFYPQELVELYKLAIQYKETGELSTCGSNSWDVMVIR